jgi:putative glycosyltransferase (TIGR04372 family)
MSLWRRTAVKLALILTTPVALIFRWSQIYFLGVGLEHRIGHLTCEPYYAWLLHQQDPNRYRKFILTYDPASVANHAVLDRLPPCFTYISSFFLRSLARPLQRHPLCSIDLGKGVRTTTGSCDLFRLVRNVPRPRQFLDLDDLPLQDAQDVLNFFHLHSYSWYVVLHNREPTTFGGQDDLHDYRNVDISSYSLAIDQILDRGGAVIRIGDPSMSELPDREGVVDYAHHHGRSPEMDLLICTFGTIFLGCDSGAMTMAAVQGVRIVATNMAPLGNSRVWGAEDIFIPKLYRSALTGDLISFRTIFESREPCLADMRDTSSFLDAGVCVEDNDPYEICQALVEGLDGGERFAEVESKRLRFDSLFHQDNYSFFSASRISAHFLHKYSELLDGD